MGQQVQAQVDVTRIGGWRVEVDRAGEHLTTDAAGLVPHGKGLEPRRPGAGVPVSDGEGYHVSRVCPSSVIVARPVPEAVRVMRPA